MSRLPCSSSSTIPFPQHKPSSIQNGSGGGARGWAYTPRTRNTLNVCPSKSTLKERKILNNVQKPNTDHFVLNLNCCVVFSHEGRTGMYLNKSKQKLWKSWCCSEYETTKCQIFCFWKQRSTQCIQPFSDFGLLRYTNKSLFKRLL